MKSLKNSGEFARTPVCTGAGCVCIFMSVLILLPCARQNARFTNVILLNLYINHERELRNAYPHFTGKAVEVGFLSGDD